MLSKQKNTILFTLATLCFQGSLFSGFEVKKIVQNPYVQVGTVAFTGATVLYLGYKNYCLKKDNDLLKGKTKELNRQNDTLVTENNTLKTSINNGINALKDDGGVETKESSLEAVIRQTVEQMQNQKKLIESLDPNTKEENWFSFLR